MVIEQLDVPAQVQTLVAALESRGLGGNAASVLNGLSGPLEQGVDRFIRGTVAGVVASPEFATLWTNLNERAHSAVVKALTGEGGGSIQLNGNDVNVDLAPVIEQVKVRLVAAGLGLAANIPTVHTSFTVYSSDTVPAIKNGFRLLQIAGDWLPVCTVLIGAAGVLLAVRRRTALIGLSLGIALSMIAFGAALAVGRTITLQQLPADASVPAVTAVFDAVLHFLRETIRMLGVLALAVALGAYLSGPARFPVAVRGRCIAGIGAVRGLIYRGGGRGPVGRVTHGVRTWLVWTVLAAASLVFVLWDHPTAAVIAWTGVCVLAALAILEFVDPSTRAETPETTPEETPEAVR